jgi:hypothetical protein
MYSARLSDLDVVDLCFVSDYQFERGIDLRITAFMAFDDRRLGTLLHDDQRTYESGARLIATGQENEIDRSLQCGAGGYADHCTVAHQGGVDRHRHVIGHEGLAYANRHQPVAFAKRVGHRPNGEARLRSQIRHVRRKNTVDKNQTAAFDATQEVTGLLRSRTRFRIRWRRQRI